MEMPWISDDDDGIVGAGERRVAFAGGLDFGLGWAARAESLQFGSVRICTDRCLFALHFKREQNSSGSCIMFT
jgi:hypothetical protein